MGDPLPAAPAAGTKPTAFPTLGQVHGQTSGPGQEQVGLNFSLCRGVWAEHTAPCGGSRWDYARDPFWLPSLWFCTVPTSCK